MKEKKILWAILEIVLFIHLDKQFDEVVAPGVYVIKIQIQAVCNVLTLHLKQTFPPIIWIFTEGGVDGITSRLSLKKDSNLSKIWIKMTFRNIKIVFFMMKIVSQNSNFVNINSQNTKVFLWGYFFIGESW